MKHLINMLILCFPAAALAALSGCVTTEDLFVSIEPNGAVALTEKKTGINVSVPVFNYRSTK